MTRHDLLSPAVGVPTALLALVLLFWVERARLRHRRMLRSLSASALLVSAALLVLIVGRFIEYS